MKQNHKSNKNRSKLFGVVINPVLSEKVDWKNMSTLEIGENLKRIGFLDRFKLTEALNNLEIVNVSKNKTTINDFFGQLELGSESRIPHYQLAIEMRTICTKRQLLGALEGVIDGHISVQIQFNYGSMKEYCGKASEFILPEYSGRICKHEWDIDFLERKPQLNKVLRTPYRWQEFVKKELLGRVPDDRTVDWIIDPVGNTGKSSFARAYVSVAPTEGILMKIDNLDRMELTVIKKIENYRMKYYKDPKVLLFDFPRASDMGKILSATALMEDVKSGYLETTFGGKHKEIQIGDIHVVVFSNNCPDLSVLSVDRWRLWTLSGKSLGNVIWPVSVIPWIKTVNTKNWNLIWTIHLKYLGLKEVSANGKFNDINLPEDWLKEFGIKELYTSDLSTHINYSPNFIKIKLASLLSEELMSLPIINFKE